MVDTCWQYLIREETLEEDIKAHNLTQETLSSLRVGDFSFSHIDKKDEKVPLVKEFIHRYEWLGSMGQFPTHRFVSMYNDIVCGAMVFSIPNAFSKLLGDGTHEIERLIARGACSSFTPKNLASNLIMKSIKWMVKNTRFRLFVAYSDPDAGELGTVYQACNFYYIGNTSGASYKCYDPEHPEWGWFSDRRFRTRSSYKVFARENGIEWQKDWTKNSSVVWGNMPEGVEVILRNVSRECSKRSLKKKQTPKHKYAYVLGKDKRETKELRKIFERRNKKLIRAYPKVRGN